MFEEMTLEDTKTLQDGKCPDCSGTKILGGPEGPGSVTGVNPNSTCLWHEAFQVSD